MKRRNLHNHQTYCLIFKCSLNIASNFMVTPVKSATLASIMCPVQKIEEQKCQGKQQPRVIVGEENETLMMKINSMALTWQTCQFWKPS